MATSSGDTFSGPISIPVSHGTGAFIKCLSLDTFTFGEKLGSGSFGIVKKAHHPTYNDVAIKILESREEAEKEAKKMKELSVYSPIMHVLCLAIGDGKTGTGIVMEWMKLGNLKTFQQKRVKNIPWALRMRMLMEISEGMFYLHHDQNPPIVHGDLKAENIFVQESLNVKIGDLGLSRSMQSMMNRYRAGTPSHMPPEYFDVKKTPNCKWDVYSFAMVQCEVGSGKNVFEELSCDVIRLEHFVKLKDVRPDIPSNCPSVVKELMKECWHGDPNKRPDFRDIKGRIKSIYDNEYQKHIHKACADCQQQLSQLPIDTPTTTFSDNLPTSLRETHPVGYQSTNQHHSHYQPAGSLRGPNESHSTIESQPCVPPTKNQLTCTDGGHASLPYDLRFTICCKLDTNNPLGNDWRMLASNLEADHLIGMLDSRFQKPTSELLKIWDSKDEEPEQLVERLHAIKRPDVAKLVENYITNQQRKPTVVGIATTSSSSSITAKIGKLKIEN